MRRMLDEFWHMLDPVAFSLGPLSVRWYGIAYVVGFSLAGVVVCRRARRWKIPFAPYDVLLFVCYIALGLVVCARLGYCLFYGNGYYFSHPLEVFAVNKGGMSFHGGMVGAVLAGLVFSRVYRIPFLTLADLVAGAVPVGLLCGRLANFVNGELYGAPTTLSWGVDFTGSGTLQHPSQLYEAALEGAVLFLVLFALSRRDDPPRPRGFFLGTFLVLYALFRILVEFVRLPDAQIGYFFGTWGTMGQLLSVPMVLVGACVLVWACRARLPQLGIGQLPGKEAAPEVAEGAAEETAVPAAGGARGAGAGETARAEGCAAGEKTPAGEGAPTGEEAPADTDLRAGEKAPADTEPQAAEK